MTSTSRVRRALERVPHLGGAARVISLVVFAVLLWSSLALWAMSSPVGSSPDDDYHIAVIYCQGGEAECVLYGARARPCFSGYPHVPGDCSRAWEDTQPITSKTPLDWYPTVYPRVMQNFIGPTVGHTVSSIRLFNVSLTVAMIMASVYLSRRTMRRAVAITWLVCMVPLGMFLVTSINPNAWSILGIAAVWGPLVSYLTARMGPEGGEGGGTTREEPSLTLTILRIAFVVLCALMALGSRSEAPVYLSFIAVAASLFAFPWPPRQALTARALRFILPAALVLISLVVYANGSSEKADSVAAADDAYTLLESFTNGMSGFAAMFGTPGLLLNSLGWFDTAIPPVAGLAALIAAASAFFIGLGVMYRRKAVATGFLLLAVVAFVTYLWSEVATYRLQPRYFYPLVFLVIGMMLLPKLESASGPPKALQVWGFAILVSYANSMSLLAQLVRYISGATFTDKDGPNIVSQAELRGLPAPHWWWLDDMAPWTLWLLGSVAFAATASIVAVAVTRWSRTPSPAPNDGPEGSLLLGMPSTGRS